jgi:hypothetical protein
MQPTKEKAMIELTPEQWQAIAQEENPTVIEPESKTAYVLVRQEVYERWRRVFDDEPDAALIVNEMMAEDDVADPHLASYRECLTPF